MFQKLAFNTEDGESIELYVIEQTRIGGKNYLLVTEEADGDGEAMILRDLSGDTDQESIYEFVEDDDELQAVGSVFESMLDDVEIVRENE
ncbi:MAG: DUF1292 domain-containing protein [Lachnospiraceae bacterium]